MADTTHVCASCGQKFLVISQEEEFLKKMNLPMPTLCPSDRQLRRLRGRGERKLFRTTCQQCGAAMVTTYDPATVSAKILCQTCYRQYYDTTDILQK
ncbi:hypothetical protein M1555_01280 [Patescibacteria group bacterium]|nr:hypothetical protein [Patescibacteria group bacterium]